MKEEIRSIAELQGTAATLDLWKDDYRKKKTCYLCATPHYMKNFKMVKRVLCTTEFDKESKKTGENIQSVVLQVLRRFDLQDCLTKSAIVYGQRHECNFGTEIAGAPKLCCVNAQHCPREDNSC